MRRSRLRLFSPVMEQTRERFEVVQKSADALKTILPRCEAPAAPAPPPPAASPRPTRPRHQHHPHLWLSLSPAQQHAAPEQPQVDSSSADGSEGEHGLDHDREVPGVSPAGGFVALCNEHKGPLRSLC